MSEVGQPAQPTASPWTSPPTLTLCSRRLSSFLFPLTSSLRFPMYAQAHPLLPLANLQLSTLNLSSASQFYHKAKLINKSIASW